MGYNAPPTKEKYASGIIGGLAGSGGVTEGTFVAYDDGTITTATSGAANVGVCMETAAEGAQTSVKFQGLALLSVNGATAIAVPNTLTPTTAGVGIKAVADTDIYNASALVPKASGTGKILVRVGFGTVSV